MALINPNYYFDGNKSISDLGDMSYFNGQILNI